MEVKEPENCVQVWMLGNLLHLWDMVWCRRIGNMWEEL